jgi:hypothetical protein
MVQEHQNAQKTNLLVRKRKATEATHVVDTGGFTINVKSWSESAKFTLYNGCGKLALRYRGQVAPMTQNGNPPTTFSRRASDA